MSNIAEQTVIPEAILEGDDRDEAELRRKLLTYVLESEGSTPEMNWRTESEEDYKFYAGKQDSQEVLDKLDTDDRPNSTFNKIMPKINMLIGLAAQSNRVPYVYPTKTETPPLAELMNGAFKHFRKKLRLKRLENECFEHMVKSGRSFLYFYLGGENPYQPRLKAKRIAGRDVLVDPLSVEYDLSDARYVVIDKWLFADDLLALYPDLKLDTIRTFSTTYGKASVPAYYDSVRNKYRISECWYRVWERVNWYKNPVTGQVEQATDEEFKKVKAALAAGIPVGQNGEVKSFEIKEHVVRMKKHVKYAIFSNMKVIDQGPPPFKLSFNDVEYFPIVLYGAYRDDEENRWFSAIKMMKDPQRMQNTVKRQMVHLLNTAQKNILAHEAGTLADEDDYDNNSSRPNYRMVINPGKWDKWKFTEPPVIPPAYNQLDILSDQDMKDTSGIQNELQGIETSSRTPVGTSRMRQDANIAVLYILFDNFRESRVLGGKILLALIQQFCPKGEMVRITGSEGAQLMQVNTQTNPEHPEFNDLTAGEYDLEVEETTDNVTMRMTIAMMLGDFNQQAPGTIPPDIMMEYMDLPWTARQKIAQYNAQQQEIQERRFQQEMQLKYGMNADKIMGDVQVAKIKGQVDLAKEEIKAKHQNKLNRGGNKNGK